MIDLSFLESYLKDNAEKRKISDEKIAELENHIFNEPPPSSKEEKETGPFLMGLCVASFEMNLQQYKKIAGEKSKAIESMEFAQNFISTVSVGGVEKADENDDEKSDETYYWLPSKKSRSEFNEAAQNVEKNLKLDLANLQDFSDDEVTQKKIKFLALSLIDRIRLVNHLM